MPREPPFGRSMPDPPSQQESAGERGPRDVARPSTGVSTGALASEILGRGHRLTTQHYEKELGDSENAND